jgi:pentatricopeptide repeat protein
LAPSSLSKSTNEPCINVAEEDFGSVLKELQEILNFSSADTKKPLGVEMKNVILRLIKSSTNTDETWKLAWSMIRQYTSQLSLTSLPDPDLIIPIEAYNTLLKFITRSSGRNSSQLQNAVQILDEIMVQSQIHPLPDLSTYTIILEAMCAESRAEQAVQILLTMKEDDIKPSLHMYELVVGACVKKNHWRRAIQLLDLLIKDQQHDAITVGSQDKEIESKVAMLYSSVISACAKSGEISRALKLYKDMCKLNVSSIPITSYNTLMSACASSDRYWKDAIHIFDELSTMAATNSTNVPNPDIYTLTIAIRACAKG